MKVVIAGAFGKLGSDILKESLEKGYEVVAADLFIKELSDLKEKFETKVIDVTKPETLAGLCDGADMVITTVGLVRASSEVTNYDIDYQGNLNLLEEAKKAGVKKFGYISVIKCDSDENVPMLHAKYLFEQKLKESGLDYVIFRPTGYFYDIAKVFMPMIEKGKVTLLGKHDYLANVVDTTDLAKFIVQKMEMASKATFDVGGKETYSYKQIAEMFFDAANKKVVIKRAPSWLFDMLAKANKRKKNGKEAIIKFSKWTLTHDLVGDNMVGELSFKEYIYSLYKKEK